MTMPVNSGYLTQPRYTTLQSPGSATQLARFGQNESQEAPASTGWSFLRNEINSPFVALKRVKDGLWRAFSMAAFRPKGWAETYLWLHGVGLIFPIKHFTEGFLHVDSLFNGRLMPSPWHVASKYHRTLKQAKAGIAAKDHEGNLWDPPATDVKAKS